MAVATYTNTSYGYRGTGGNSITTVATRNVRVQSIILVATTGADTATIVDAKGNSIMVLKGPATAGEFTQVWFEGKVLEGIKVTLSTTNAVIIIIVE